VILWIDLDSHHMSAHHEIFDGTLTNCKGNHSLDVEVDLLIFRYSILLTWVHDVQAD